MKTYSPRTTYKDGLTHEFKNPYKQKKRAIEMGLLSMRNELVEKVEIIVREDGKEHKILIGCRCPEQYHSMFQECRGY